MSTTQSAVSEMSVSDVVVRTLEELGIRRVFGIPGGASMHLDNRFARSEKIRYTLCGDEIGSAFQAQAYGVVSGTVGVTVDTSGPAAEKIFTGLANAFMDSQPLMALTGNVARGSRRDAFQGLDVVPAAIAGNFVKAAVYVDSPENVAKLVASLYLTALSGRPGSVLLDFPRDVQSMKTVYGGLDGLLVRGEREPVDRELVRRVAYSLRRAERPLLILGQGARGASQEVQKLVESEDLYAICTLFGLNVLPWHSRNLGMGGMHGQSFVNLAHSKSDFRLYVGSSLDDRLLLGSDSGEGYDGVTIVHVDIDRNQIGNALQPTYGVVADSKEFLAALLWELKGIGERTDHSSWNESIELWSRELSNSDFRDEPYLLSEHVIDVVGEVFGRDLYVVTDVGAHQMRVAQRLGMIDHASGRFGCMGYAMGAALGTICAVNDYGLPSKSVVAFVGDGGSIMSSHEWYDVARAVAEFGVDKTPLKVVVFADGVLGMVNGWQKKLFDGKTETSDLTCGGRIQFDFSKIAGAFQVRLDNGSLYTVPSRIVDTRSELENAVAEMYQTPGPFLLQVNVPARPVLPIIFPGGNTSTAIHSYDPSTGEYATLKAVAEGKGIVL